MKRSCDQGGEQDTSFLRLVLIGEIIQADDTALYAMAEALHRLGLLDLAVDDADPESERLPHAPPRRSHLRLVQ